MAVKLAFTPAPIDPKTELMKQLEAAPREHAEALLELFRTLQTAHDQGVLGLANGLIGGKDAIATEVAKGMNTTEGVSAIRNAIALAKIAGSIDPDLLQRITDGLAQSSAEATAEKEPPSLWQLFKRAISKDARRGMSFGVRLLVSLGRATAGEPTGH
ncbi:MAG: DUF1641 domain-containing protein [Acidobacteriaceae bacterium]|nr:DUF1641 domain-containing protein [Acidobacteriaceae bacterium]